MNQKITDNPEEKRRILPLVPSFIESYEEDNGVANFDVNFLFPKN